VIAEFKKASPSVGEIAPGADPAATAMAYEAGGASAVSVLAEPSRFSGSFDDVSRARGATSLPVLCKDFVVHHDQLLLSRAAGADAVLLMVSILGDSTGAFLHAADEVGLAALVEVHDEREYEIAAASGARIIGVNARDLRDLSVDVERSWGLVSRAAAEGFCVVAESGMRTEADVRHAAEQGAKAVLVGEALMRADDPAQAVRQLAGIPASRVGRA
jgi:indole-3-glycerol phosphate synthase